VPRASTGLNLINLQIKEFKKGKTKFLFNTEAAVTLVKRNLKREMLIYEDKMTLAGIRTRNNCYRKNSCYHIIRWTPNTALHVRNCRWFSIDYKDILGIDFLRKHLAKCYSNKLLKIGDNILKLYPYKITRINSKHEAIIETTTINDTGIIQISKKCN